MRRLFVFSLVLFLLACGKDSSAQAVDELTIGPHTFKIELALTPQQQARGLMGRTSMKENEGMLFIFGDESPRAFWMKNTLIPLDMIFIRRDGTIHHIHENAQPNDLTSIPSHGPVSAVLELKGGLSAKLDITKGDRVRHVVFGNAQE